MPTPNDHLTRDQADERQRRREALGSRIRELRQAAGRTQEQVALAASLDRPFFVQVEGGKRSPRADRLADIASALGVTVAELFPE